MTTRLQSSSRGAVLRSLRGGLAEPFAKRAAPSEKAPAKGLDEGLEVELSALGTRGDEQRE